MLPVKPDIPLLLIALLLTGTLTAFLSGYFFYPFGLIVLLVMLGARIFHLNNRRKNQASQLLPAGVELFVYCPPGSPGA